VTPVTHSIGNCIKRVVVIVASIIIFQNPVSTQNAIGGRRGAEGGDGGAWWVWQLAFGAVSKEQVAPPPAG
jgi:hypothetical protein